MNDLINKKVLWAEIDLDAFRHNINIIRQNLKPGTKVCAVVKANAYGHDAVEVSRFLSKEGKVDYFAVSRIEEGIVLRKHDVTLPILNLGYTPEEAYTDGIAYGICMATYSYESAKKLNEIAKILGKKALIHIKIDTGMSRIGFRVSEESADEIKKISELENISIEGIFSHFATADCDRDYALYQEENFRKMLKMLEERNVDVGIRHISNSAGIENFDNFNYDMVRCGIIMYGSQATDDEETLKKFPLRHPMTMKSRVTLIKVLPPNTGIGYGIDYRTKDYEKIVSIGLGYADGFFRFQSNPTLTIKGREYPVVGRICMDQCMIRVGMDDDINVGDEVIVFGNGGKSIDQFAKECSTITHEVLCDIGRRVVRMIYDKDELISERNYLYYDLL